MMGIYFIINNCLLINGFVKTFSACMFCFPHSDHFLVPRDFHRLCRTCVHVGRTKFERKLFSWVTSHGPECGKKTYRVSLVLFGTKWFSVVKKEKKEFKKFFIGNNVTIFIQNAKTNLHKKEKPGRIL